MDIEENKRRKWLKQIFPYKKKSKNFLFPMIGVEIYHINDKVNYLIDVSLIEEGFPKIVLIFDNIDYVPLKEDLQRLMSSYLFIDADYGDDDKEVILYFDVPKEYKIDFEFFKTGKYSQFSDKYKEMLTNVYGNERNSGVSPVTHLPNVNMYDVIYPSKKVKELLGEQLGVDWRIIKEVLDPPNIEYEEFKTIEELI